MDVKTKFAPSPARGTAANAKKNRGVNNELHLETLRRREPTGASNNDRPTKYNVQKTKDFVKRPKPKGQYHGGTEENSKVVEEKFPERSSALIQKNKKENGNFLLNFHYETREPQSRDIGRHSCNSNRSLPPVQRHKYNKEQFVQASCQFVVTANRDYSLYMSKPDTLVDWKLIEQIKFHNSENFSCPICLHAPVAAKMTRCGHVYCWPCILRYLRYCQETGNYKCPICDEYLHKNDLKSVVEITRSTYNLGETVNLRLMRLDKTTYFVTPVEPVIQPPTTFLSVSENANNQIYSKLLMASVKDILDIIECEHSELELELKNNPDMALDIKQALNELSKRKEKLLWKAAEFKDAPSMENVTEKEIAEETSQGSEINTACCKDDVKSLVKQSSIGNTSSDSQLASNSPRFSYFYQAKDGQHMFLHTINVKMLEMQYGNLEHCPPIITGKLLEKEASICTEDLRKRLKYLYSLSVTCPFEVVEIELKPPFISEETLHIFQTQLKIRQKYRKQREREERKREKKIIEQENRQIGIFPTPNIDIESYQHFPQLQSELQFSNEPILSPSESAASSIASSPPLNTFDGIAPKQDTTDNSCEQTRTFADIAKSQSTMVTKTHNKSTNAWPPVKSKTYSGLTMLSNKNEEEVPLTMATKAHNKYVNAWPSVKPKTNVTSTLSNKDEEVPSTMAAYNKSVNAWPFVKSRTYSDITSTLVNKDEVAPTKTHDKSTNAWPAVKSGTYSSTTGSSSNEDEKKPYVSEQAKNEDTTGKKKKKKKGKGKEKEVVLFTTGTSGYSL